MSEEMSELDMIRQVASDRLVYMRLMEKAVNDIDMVLRALKQDIMEISQQVASRNEDMTLEPSEDEAEDESDDWCGRMDSMDFGENRSDYPLNYSGTWIRWWED